MMHVHNSPGKMIALIRHLTPFPHTTQPKNQCGLIQTELGVTFINDYSIIECQLLIIYNRSIIHQLLFNLRHIISLVSNSIVIDCLSIFTTRKRSLRRLCFYTCLSVILFIGRGSTWAGTPWAGTPPGRYTPRQVPSRQVQPPVRYTPQAGVALCVESNINKSIINIDKFIIVQ